MGGGTGARQRPRTLGAMVMVWLSPLCRMGGGTGARQRPRTIRLRCGVSCPLRLRCVRHGGVTIHALTHLRQGVSAIGD